MDLIRLIRVSNKGQKLGWSQVSTNYCWLSKTLYLARKLTARDKCICQSSHIFEIQAG